jgi:hypothetical protein
MFADSHVHPLMKFLHNDRGNVWESFRGNWFRLRIKDDFVGIPEYSQADFTKLAKARVQIIFCALIPPEQKFMFSKWAPPVGPKVEKMVSGLLSIPYAKIQGYQSPQYDHYQLLIEERNRLFANANNPVQIRDGGRTINAQYTICNTFAEVQQVIQRNRTNTNQWTIAVIPAVEGAHALGRGHLHLYGAMNPDAPDALFMERLDKLKGLGADSDSGKVWQHPPLLMNLTHAFDNGLCGQAQALSGMMRDIFEYDEPYEPHDQGPNFSVGLHKGITPLGERVILRMLNLDAESAARPNPGRSIIPDIKHMSLPARQRYYEILDQANAGRPVDKRIPVVMSHAGVTGTAFPTPADLNGRTLEQYLHGTDVDDAYKNAEGFNPWSINLYNEELVRIHETRGLIGLIMEERILGGKKKIKKLKAALEGRAGLKNPFRGYTKTGMCTKLLTDQIFHVVDTVFRSATTVAPAQVWDVLCIGSDFDGQINPVDYITEATDFPQMKTELIRQLGEPRFVPFYAGQTPEQLADKICQENVVGFLERNL